MKRKRILTTILLLLIVVFGFSFTACNNGGNTPESLQNEYGIVVDGGSFEEGSTLVSNEITAITEAAEVLAIIADQDYNKENNFYIYDIHVTKDGVKVQPDGKVKVSVPVPNAAVNKYIVFHIKDDNSVESLASTVADGKISFEIDCFSRFIFIEDTETVSCTHVFGVYEKIDNVSCLEMGRIARQCTLCGYIEITTAQGSHKYGELIPGKNATYYSEGALSYYTCSDCRGIFNESKEPITSTIIPKITPEFTLYLDGELAGEFTVSSATSSKVILALDSVSVTKGQTVTIREKNGLEECEYVVIGTNMDSVGTLWGNVDPKAKTIRSTSTSTFIFTLQKSEGATLKVDGYVNSGIVIEITSIDTRNEPVYFPMTKVDSLEGSENEAYVFGLLGSDKTTSFRIIDLDNDMVYDYDDISESMSYDTWSYSCGENDSIQFSSQITDWWIAFDIGGDKEITLRRYNLPSTRTPTLVFESGDALAFEKSTLTPDSKEYDRYSWPLTNGIFGRTDVWSVDLSSLTIYKAAVHVDSSVRFYIGLGNLTTKIGAEYLSLVILNNGTLIKNGDYIELTKPGDYIIEYLPFCNVINVIDPTLDPVTDAHEHAFVDGKCECGADDPSYVPPHEHSYTEVVTAPTCTSEGYTTYTCGCGDSYVGNKVDATGHSYSEGSCSSCGEVDPDYTPDSDSKIIDRIDVLGVTMPYTGKKPATDDEPYVLQAGLEILSVEWVKEDDYNYGNYLPFGPDDYFEYENSRYIVKVCLQLKSGYQFNCDPEYGYYYGYATVNYVLSWDVSIHDNIIEYYTYLGCNDTTIYYAGIVGVTEPVPDAHPDFNFITVYEGFHIAEVRWYDESEGDGTPGSGRLMTSDDVFVEGGQYYLEIDICVDEGYSFFVDVYGVWVSVFINEMETGAEYDDLETANEKLTISFGYYCMFPEE